MCNSLLEKTLALVAQTELSVTELCRRAGITTRWYYQFVSGQTSDPGVLRVQRLHDVLAAELAERSPDSSIAAGQPAAAQPREVLPHE